MRLVWLAGGLLCVGLGGLGIVVPGLPATVFFIMAAWCFSRSSRRLEQWVLNLPGFGPMVQDYRDGLGMPRRAKVFAIGSIVVACTVSAGFLIGPLTIRLLVAAVGAIGVWWVGWRIPTRPDNAHVIGPLGGQPVGGPTSDADGGNPLGCLSPSPEGE